MSIKRDIITQLIEYIVEHQIPEMSMQQIVSKVDELSGNKDLGINIIAALKNEGVIDTNDIRQLGNHDYIFKINLDNAQKYIEGR